MFATINSTVDSAKVVLEVDVQEADAAAKIADLQAVAKKWMPGGVNEQNLEGWARDPLKVLAIFHPRGED